jgi:hypothetical protein
MPESGVKEKLQKEVTHVFADSNVIPDINKW